MQRTTVSIADGKKGFSSVIQKSIDNQEEIIITKRGKPVVVIIPYDEYLCSRRREGYRKIISVRDEFAAAGVQAADIYEEAKKEREARQ
ncbi:MAG: type II toxin-antitoxin system Phd/YefM family antitoxin [Smithellaceae bacterium]|nr:type II toxin-antitoxin system Phd/YefM family antitoxin [Smithellaceae bacterium]